MTAAIDISKTPRWGSEPHPDQCDGRMELEQGVWED